MTKEELEKSIDEKKRAKLGVINEEDLTQEEIDFLNEEIEKEI